MVASAIKEHETAKLVDNGAECTCTRPVTGQGFHGRVRSRNRHECRLARGCMCCCQMDVVDNVGQSVVSVRRGAASTSLST